jgi:hypothetical protein
LISEFSSANIDFFLRKETINKNEVKTNMFLFFKAHLLIYLGGGSK